MKKNIKNKLLESNRVTYNPKHKERMNAQLEHQLRKNDHSLGEHPAFPSGDEQNFSEKLASKRFEDLTKNYKKQYEVRSFEGPEVLMNTTKHLKKSIDLEEKHHKELVDIAIELVKEEFDIPDGEINFDAELTLEIDSKAFEDNYLPRAVEDIEFEDHASIENTNNEIIKRRFVNSMIQGSAKKCSHMFHLVEDKITDLDPRLNNNYSKLMAGADLMYFLINDKVKMTPGGIVDVEFPKKENEPPTIHVKATCFPILIHELVKGVMEIISSHGLPEDPKILEYVLAKADYTASEPWDMRLGVGAWERFMDSIDYNDFDLKNYIYSDIVSLPSEEFNDVMREILAGTKKGKLYVKSMAESIRNEIKRDDFNASLIDGDFDDDDFFGSPDEFDDIDTDLI